MSRRLSRSGDRSILWMQLFQMRLKQPNDKLIHSKSIFRNSNATIRECKHIHFVSSFENVFNELTEILQKLWGINNNCVRKHSYLLFAQNIIIQTNKCCLVWHSVYWNIAEHSYHIRPTNRKHNLNSYVKIFGINKHDEPNSYLTQRPRGWMKVFMAFKWI